MFCPRSSSLLKYFCSRPVGRLIIYYWYREYGVTYVVVMTIGISACELIVYECSVYVVQKCRVKFSQTDVEFRLIKKKG